MIDKISNLGDLIERELKTMEAVDRHNFFEMPEIESDMNQTDERFYISQLNSILESLYDVTRNINYLISDVIGDFILHKNEKGRYECEVREFVSGCSIEALIYDDFYEKPTWVKTSIEHDGDDYYLVANKNISLEGLKIRIRKENNNF